ncbi:MAG: VOC family protein [Phycisphaerales bacterium]|nr:VOC family protein [Phycisphaerales bacterium]
MPSPLNFDGSLTISMQVKDRKRSVKWYGEVLGASLIYDVEEIGWCEVTTEVEGGKVALGFSQVESPKTGAGPVPVFGVKDIDAARARMEKQSVKFDGPTVTIPGMVRLATFFDPDGNAMMLHQSLQH